MGPVGGSGGGSGVGGAGGGGDGDGAAGGGLSGGGENGGGGRGGGADGGGGGRGGTSPGSAGGNEGGGGDGGGGGGGGGEGEGGGGEGEGGGGEGGGGGGDDVALGGGGGDEDGSAESFSLNGQQHSVKQTEPSPAPAQLFSLAQPQPQLLTNSQLVGGGVGLTGLTGGDGAAGGTSLVALGPSEVKAAAMCALKASGQSTILYWSVGSPLRQPHSAKRVQPVWYATGNVEHSVLASEVVLWRVYQSPSVYDECDSSRPAGCVSLRRSSQAREEYVTGGSWHHGEGGICWGASAPAAPAAGIRAAYVGRAIVEVIESGNRQVKVDVRLVASGAPRRASILLHRDDDPVALDGVGVPEQHALAAADRVVVGAAAAVVGAKSVCEGIGGCTRHPQHLAVRCRAAVVVRVLRHVGVG